MGHFWASVHVGVRFKAQVHHHGDGPGLLGAAISKAVFLTECNIAVSRTRRWMSLPTNFLAIELILASSTHGSLDSAAAVIASAYPVYAAAFCTFIADAA